MLAFRLRWLSFVLFILGLTGMLSLAVVASNLSVMQSEVGNLAGIQMPHHPHDVHNCEGGRLGDGSTELTDDQYEEKIFKVPTITKTSGDYTRINMKRGHSHKHTSGKESLLRAILTDASRVQGIHRRTQTKWALPSQSSGFDSRVSPALSSVPSSGVVSPPSVEPVTGSSAAPDSIDLNHNFKGTVESGISLGSGEYFMDVFIGTPPRHFSLILDTGSDLNWVQCDPCNDCYRQEGPRFNPNQSSSYTPVACTDSHCKLVYTTNEQECSAEKPRGCSYFYWYGDSSNTTGDLAMETFSLNATGGGLFKVENVTFGCGHINRGLFRGAGGLLGLGRGPLSFASQLLVRYGQKFSYCLVDRDSNLTVSSTLTFGEDKVLSSHPDLQYTSFITNTSRGTFYYLDIKKISIDGEDLPIPSSTLKIDSEGLGGTIIDSGTTLTYFAKPAYEAIEKAMQDRISYPPVNSGILDVCYNVSGVTDVHFPSFSITFKDGAVWKFPSDNYFIDLYPNEHIACLAILPAPSAGLSILGNFLQQNMHVLYDLEKSRLAYAPMSCDGLS